MSRDTLLLVTTSYPDRGDGSEAAGSFVADLAEALADRIPVRVVAPGAKAGAKERHGDVHIWRFASPGRPLSLLSPARPADWPAIIRTLRSLRAETLAAADDDRVAHILALWVLPSGWAAASLQRRLAIPYSVWALGSDIWTLGRVPGVRSVLRRVIRGAAHRFADGLQLGEEATRLSGSPFEFLPSTRRLDGHRSKPLASAPPYRLLFLGRWHPNKGIDLLLDALVLLDENSWTRIAEVHIAGGGPMEGLVQERVHILRAAGRPIRLSAYLDRSNASAAIADADWLVIPSRIESIPVVFSDAMKLGCPVIATPVGDLPRLLAQDSVGIVAEGTAPIDIARAITKGLSIDLQALVPGTRSMAARFSVEGVANTLMQRMLSRAVCDANPIYRTESPHRHVNP